MHDQPSGCPAPANTGAAQTCESSTITPFGGSHPDLSELPVLATLEGAGKTSESES